MPVCPNLSNPIVKKEFNDLVKTYGENKAYYLWDKYEGNIPKSAKKINPNTEKWFRDRFGKNSVFIKSSLGNIPGAEVLGYVQGAAAYLKESAPVDTKYHEGFHLFFRTTLNDAQRNDLYNEFAKTYGTSYLETIPKLEAMYPEASPEELRNLAIEESLAEMFREYAVLQEAPKTLSKKIVKFFKDLWAYITSLVTNKLTIEKAFALLESGKIPPSFTRNVNKFGEQKVYMIKEYAQNIAMHRELVDVATKKIIDRYDKAITETDGTKEQLKTAGVRIFSELMGDPNAGIESSIRLEFLRLSISDSEGRELPYSKLLEYDALLKENDVEKLDAFVISNDYYGTPPVMTIAGTPISNNFYQDPLLDDDSEYTRLENLATDFKRVYTYWYDDASEDNQRVGFRTEILNALPDFGIRVSKETKRITEEASAFEDEFKEQERVYDINRLEEDPEKKLTKQQKILLSRIPVDSNKKSFTGLPTYIPGTEVYKTLLELAVDKKNLVEMLNAIEVRSEAIPYLRHVHEFILGLSAREQAAFFNVFNMSYHKFVTLKIESNIKTGTVINKLFSPNSGGVQKQYELLWRNRSTLPGGILSKRLDASGNIVGYQVNPEKSKKINELRAIAGFSEDGKLKTTKFDVDQQVAFAKMLMEMGFEIGESEKEAIDRLQKMLKTKVDRTNISLTKLIARTEFERILKQFISGKELPKNPFEDEGRTINEFINAFVVPFEVSKVQSFVNNLNKSIYPINLKMRLNDEAIRIKNGDLLTTLSTSVQHKVGNRSSILYKLLTSKKFSMEHSFEDIDVVDKDGDAIDITKARFSTVLGTRLALFVNNGASTARIIMDTQGDRGKTTSAFFPKLRTIDQENDYGIQFKNVSKLFEDDILLELNRMNEAWVDIEQAIKTDNYSQLIEGYHYRVDKSGKRDFTRGGWVKFNMLDNYTLPVDAIGKPTTDAAGVNFFKILTDASFSIKNDTPNSTEVSKVVQDIGKLIEQQLLQNEEELLGSVSNLKEIVDVHVASAYKGNPEELAREYSRYDYLSRYIYRQMLMDGVNFNKNAEDIIKRTQLLTTPGMKPALKGDIPADLNYGLSRTYEATTIRDVFKSLPEEDLKKFESNISSIYGVGAAKQIMKSFTRIQTTDAFSAITVKHYYEILEGRGRETEDIKRAYETYKQTRVWTAKTPFIPLKPSYDGRVNIPMKNESGEYRYTLSAPFSDKTSYIVFTPDLVRGIPILENLLDRMELKGSYAGNTNLRPIDVLQTESAQKKSIIPPHTLSADNIDDLSNMVTMTMDSQFLRFPEDTPEKKEKSEILLGKQIRVNGIANVRNELEYTYNAGLAGKEVKVTGKQLKDLFQAALSNKLDRMAKAVYDDLGYTAVMEAPTAAARQEALKEFRKKVREELLNLAMEDASKFPEALLEAVSINPETGETYLPLSYASLQGKFDQLLFSIFKNKIYKQKTNGVQMVQFPDIGKLEKADDLNKELKFLTIGKDRLVHAEVDISGDVLIRMGIPKQIIEEAIVTGNLSKIDESLKRLIGYRIPQQGKSSMMIMRIRKILPSTHDGIIRVPSGITTMMGSDFDIDKMFIMFPEMAGEESVQETPVTPQTRVGAEVISENYTPELLKANPDKLFLFGDNNTRTGKGGQAIIRDEPNALGISTKLRPANTADAFMSDAQLAENKAVIDSDIRKAKEKAAKEGKIIALPKGGFGTGLAALATKAPQTFAYLNKRLQEEFGFNNTTGELSALQPTQPTISLEPSAANKGRTEQELIDYLQEKYPEIKLTITNNPVWEQGDNIFNQEEFDTQVQYRLKAVDLLLSDRAAQVFAKGEKGNWNLDKILTELAVPKEQKKIILNLGKTSREEILTDLLSSYSYPIEIYTAREGYKSTTYYSDLTVRGGTNYTENEIATPGIIPFIKGHAKFATDNGIGWFRSDDRNISEEQLVEEENLSFEDFFKKAQEKAKTKDATKARRILEIQSDLFQTRNLENLIDPRVNDFIQNIGSKPTGEFYFNNKQYRFDLIRNTFYEIENGKSTSVDIDYFKKIASQFTKFYSQNIQNNFLQLLHKDNNWVTFFIKSIIQDSAKQGYEKVLFPSGDTVSKVEGHSTLEQFKREKENRIKELEQEKAGASNKYALFDLDPGMHLGTFNSIEEAKKKAKQLRLEDNYEITPADKWGNKLDLDRIDYEINLHKQDLERVETEGFGALKPIYNFYETTVANILRKQGYSPTEITDEYGNTWNEISINQARDLGNVLLQKDEAGKIIGQANIQAMTVLVDAVNKKADTIPHEYAHHYIAWFRNTPIVQEGIKRFGSEEALVQAIGEQVVKQQGEAYNWWKKFTNWLLDLLSDKQLLQILTDSFINRQDLNEFTYSQAPAAQSKPKVVRYEKLFVPYEQLISNPASVNELSFAQVNNLVFDTFEAVASNLHHVHEVVSPLDGQDLPQLASESPYAPTNMKIHSSKDSIQSFVNNMLASVLVGAYANAISGRNILLSADVNPDLLTHSTKAYPTDEYTFIDEEYLRNEEGDMIREGEVPMTVVKEITSDRLVEYAHFEDLLGAKRPTDYFMSLHLSAALDAVKSYGIQAALNDNNSTASMYIYLYSKGLSPRQAVTFMNHPVVRLVTSSPDSISSTIKGVIKSLVEAKVVNLQDLKNYSSFENTKTIDFRELRKHTNDLLDIDITKEVELFSAIEETYPGAFLKVLGTLSRINTMANDYNNLLSSLLIINIDKSGTTAQNLAMLDKIEFYLFNQSLGSIYGNKELVSELFLGDAYPIVKSTYETLKTNIKLASDANMLANQPALKNFREAVSALNAGNPLNEIEQKRVLNAARLYMVTHPKGNFAKSGLMSKSLVQQMFLSPDNNIITMHAKVKELLAREGITNACVESLEPTTVSPTIDYVGFSYLKFDNTKTKDINSNNAIYAGWNALYFNPTGYFTDPQEIDYLQTYAKMLVLNTTISTGFAPGPKSNASLIPPAILGDMGAAEDMRTMLNEFNSNPSHLVDNFFELYVRGYLSHTRFLRQYKGKAFKKGFSAYSVTKDVQLVLSSEFALSLPLYFKIDGRLFTSEIVSKAENEKNVNVRLTVIEPLNIPKAFSEIGIVDDMGGGETTQKSIVAKVKNQAGVPIAFIPPPVGTSPADQEVNPARFVREDTFGVDEFVDDIPYASQDVLNSVPPNTGAPFPGEADIASASTEGFKTTPTADDFNDTPQGEGTSFFSLSKNLDYDSMRRDMPYTLTQKINRLKKSFLAAGVNITVVLDTLPDGVKGMVKGGIVYLDPDQVTTDTAYHELGHILIDMLPTEQVDKYIDEIKSINPELYEAVKNAYPELDERELGIEALVTAIGIEGARIEKDSPSLLRRLINKILRALGRLFGIRPNAAEILAEKMFAGDLKSLNINKQLNDQLRLSKVFGDSVDRIYQDATEHLERRLSQLKHVKETPDTEKERLRIVQMESTLKKMSETKDTLDGFLSFNDFVLNQVADVENALNDIEAARNAPIDKDQALVLLNKATKVRDLLGIVYNANRNKSITDQIVSVLQDNLGNIGEDNKEVGYKVLANLNAALVKMSKFEERFIDNVVPLVADVYVSYQSTELDQSIQEITDAIINNRDTTVNTFEMVDPKIKQIVARKPAKGTIEFAEWEDELIQAKVDYLKNKKSGREGIINELTSAYRDKSLFSMWLDPLVYSNQTNLQLFAISFKEGEREANKKAMRDLIEAEEVYNRYKQYKGSDFNKETFFKDFLTKVNLTVKDAPMEVLSLVQPYRRDEYYANMNAMYEAISVGRPDYSDEAAYNAWKKSTAFGIYRKSRADWWKNNSKKVPNADQRYADLATAINDKSVEVKVQSALGNTAAAALLETELKELRIKAASVYDEAYDVYMGELAMPNDNYLDPQYVKIQSTPELKEFYDFLLKLYNKGQNIYGKNTPQFKNSWDEISYIAPTVSNSTLQSLLERGVKGAVVEFKENLKAANTDQEIYGAAFDQNDNPVKFLPRYFTNPVEEKLVTKDILSSILMFNHKAYQYEEKSKLTGLVNAMTNIYERRDVIKTDDTGRGLLNREAMNVKNMFGESFIGDTRVTVSGRDSNTYRHLQEFIDVAYYGILKKPLDSKILGMDPNKVAGKLNAISSMGNLSFNLLQVANQAILDTSTQITEAVASEYFTKEDYSWAQGQFAKLGGGIRDIGQFAPKTKLGKAMMYFNALTDVTDNVGRDASNNKFLKALSQDNLFMLQGAVEYQTAAVRMLALMKTTEGKFKNANGEVIMNAEGKPANVLDVMVETPTGLEYSPEVDLNQSEYNETVLSNKIAGLTKRTNQVKGNLDAPLVGRTPLGTLFMLYKQYFIPNWRKRFGHGEEYHIDHELGSITRGSYYSLASFLKLSKKAYENGASIGEVYAGLSKVDKRNLKRVMMDASFILAAKVIYAICSSILEDDDDDENYHVAFMAYQARRLQTELLAYTPVIGLGEAIRLAKNPIAAASRLEKTWDFSKHLLTTEVPYSFLTVTGIGASESLTEDAIYQRDSYWGDKGERKSMGKLKKITPIFYGASTLDKASIEDKIRFFDDL